MREEKKVGWDAVGRGLYVSGGQLQLRGRVTFALALISAASILFSQVAAAPNAREVRLALRPSPAPAPIWCTARPHLLGAGSLGR